MTTTKLLRTPQDRSPWPEAPSRWSPSLAALVACSRGRGHPREPQNPPTSVVQQECGTEFDENEADENENEADENENEADENEARRERATRTSDENEDDENEDEGDENEDEAEENEAERERVGGVA